MDIEKAYQILNSNNHYDIFYQDRPVWIQEISNLTAKVGFIDNFEEQDVYISDLYELIDDY